jgi:hypothetical protein
VALQHAPEETLGRRFAISARLYEYVNEVAVLIHGTPQIQLPALNFNEDLVDEERIAVTSVHAPQSASVRGTELVTPQPNRFTTDLDTPLCQHIFNIVVTEIESAIQPHCILDDIGRKSVAFIRVGECVHSPIVA